MSAPPTTSNSEPNRGTPISIIPGSRPRWRGPHSSRSAPMPSFPIARRLFRFAKRARRNWLARHQNAFNFWIHMVGIPVAVAGVPLLFVADWEWGVGALALGYLLQWVGHRVEGNDVGELIPLKRLLGLPVVAIAPQYAAADPATPEQA